MADKWSGSAQAFPPIFSLPRLRRPASVGKQPEEVLRGGLGEALEFHALEFRDMGCHVAHVGGPVRFSPVGNGGEIGGVGFYQDAVHGCRSSRVLDDGGVLVGDDAGEREVKTEIEGRFGGLPVFDETVHDAADFRCPFLAQDAQDVVPGVAAVDHQRFSDLPGGEDMASKALLLPFEVFLGIDLGILVAIGIEAGFTDGEHLSILGELHQFFHGGFRPKPRIGMNAHGGEYPLEAMGVVDGVFGRGKVDGNGKEVLDAGAPGIFHERGRIAAFGGEIQVTMGIDKHGRLRIVNCEINGESVQ